LEKLSNAGITTVETLADMTPEELEAIPGIDPETVEKISVAVNNYFSTLESAEQVVSADAVDAEFPSEPLLAADNVSPEAATAEAQSPVDEPETTEEQPPVEEPPVEEQAPVKVTESEVEHPDEQDENRGNK
jgi:N utilization substance protein A